jgi:hypothetical protein
MTLKVHIHRTIHNRVRLPDDPEEAEVGDDTGVCTAGKLLAGEVEDGAALTVKLPFK